MLAAKLTHSIIKKVYFYRDVIYFINLIFFCGEPIILPLLNYLYQLFYNSQIIYTCIVTIEVRDTVHYFLYQTCVVCIRFIFFCNCKIPYNNASAVGGQPTTLKIKIFINRISIDLIPYN